MKILSTRDLVLIALFAALTAVCSWISVPILAVPFTLQTFAVELTLFCLGGKRGFLAILVYLMMGLIGIPVFAGFNGGAGYLLGPTGGYVLGFLVTALLWSLAENRIRGGRAVRLLWMAAALAGCYAVGTVWFWGFYGRSRGMNLWAVLQVCVVPFLIPDAAKLILAGLVSERVQKAVFVLR